MADTGDNIGGFGATSVVGGRLRFYMQVDGGERVDFLLSRFGAEAGDLSDFWRQLVAPKVIEDIQAGFETEGDPVGGWPALSPAYAKWKARKFPGRKILELTGRLKDSLTLDRGGIGEDGVYTVTPSSLTLGTEVPYAQYHQYGTGIMPQRRFLWLADVQEFGKMLHRYLVARAEAGGWRSEP